VQAKLSETGSRRRELSSHRCATRSNKALAAPALRNPDLVPCRSRINTHDIDLGEDQRLEDLLREPAVKSRKTPGKEAAAALGPLTSDASQLASAEQLEDNG